MSNNRVINIASIKIACRDCSLRELCLPVGLEEADVRRLESTVQRKRSLKKGEALYRMGDTLRSLYAISSGSIKTVGLIEDGRTQVTGFYLPGELLGMDAISTDRHPCTAEALEPTRVCEIPFNSLEALSQTMPSLQRQLMKIMSREIVQEEHQLMVLGRMKADERLASCLMSLLRRLRLADKSPVGFTLSMSRQELGDYLGLALETVSRLFSRMQDEGIIRVQGRSVEVLDIARLNDLACGRSLEQREAR